MESELLLVDNFDKCATRLDEVHTQSKVIALEFDTMNARIVELLKQACDDYKLTHEMVFCRTNDNSNIKSFLDSQYFIENFVEALKCLHDDYKYECKRLSKCKLAMLKNKQNEIKTLQDSKMRFKAHQRSALEHKYSTHSITRRFNLAKKQCTKLEILFDEINQLKNGIKEHPFRHECKTSLDTFRDMLKNVMVGIRQTSTYKNNYTSRQKLDQLVTEGKLAKKYKPISTTENAQNMMQTKLNTFMSNWRSETQMEIQDIDNVMESLDESFKFTLLYGIISHPYYGTLNMYKYVCGKFFELLDQYPYLIDYDAILTHPIACELMHQTNYCFFNTNIRDNTEAVKKRNYFFGEMIRRNSELLIHIDVYGTTVLEKLVM